MTWPLAWQAGDKTQGTSSRYRRQIARYLAMPVVLTAREEIDLWMNAPAEEALKLQRPLPDNSLTIVARGDKKDEGGLAA